MNHAPSFYAQSGANITEVLQWGHCTSRESRCVTAGFVTGNYRFLLLLFLILQLLGRQLMRRAYVDMALHVPELYALTFGSAVRVAQSADPYEAGFGAYAELRTLVRDASRSGLEPDLVTLMLWAMMHGSVMLVIAGHTEPDLHLDDPLNLVGHAASALLEITLPVETRRSATPTLSYGFTASKNAHRAAITRTPASMRAKQVKTYPASDRSRPRWEGLRVG